MHVDRVALDMTTTAELSSVGVVVLFVQCSRRTLSSGVAFNTVRAWLGHASLEHFAEKF
jgi:hypothetical protein